MTISLKNNPKHTNLHIHNAAKSKVANRPFASLFRNHVIYRKQIHVFGTAMGLSDGNTTKLLIFSRLAFETKQQIQQVFNWPFHGHFRFLLKTKMAT